MPLWGSWKWKESEENLEGTNDAIVNRKEGINIYSFPRDQGGVWTEWQVTPSSHVDKKINNSK